MSDLPPPPQAAPSLLDRAAARFAFQPPQAFLAVAGLAGAALAAVVLAGSFRTAPPPEISLPRAAATSPSSRAAPASLGEIVVHVAGAVHQPGVYRLVGTVRVADAIAEAGGPTADADVHLLNLAAPLRDGDRVYVPRMGETAPAAGAGASEASEASGPLDLNRATAAELEQLPGIGPAIAAAIVEHRDEHGPFGSVEHLLEVPGIGAAKLAALRDLVRV